MPDNQGMLESLGPERELPAAEAPMEPQSPASEERHSAPPQTYEAKPRCGGQDTNPKGPTCCYGGYSLSHNSNS